MPHAPPGLHGATDCPRPCGGGARSVALHMAGDTGRALLDSAREAIASASSTSDAYTIQSGGGGYRQAPRSGQAAWLRGLRNASADAVAHLLRTEVGQQSGPAQSCPQDVGARAIGRGHRSSLSLSTELALFRNGVIANASLAAILQSILESMLPGWRWE
jgi:hypothetical protein